MSYRSEEVAIFRYHFSREARVGVAEDETRSNSERASEIFYEIPKTNCWNMQSKEGGGRVHDDEAVQTNEKSGGLSRERNGTERSLGDR